MHLLALAEELGRLQGPRALGEALERVAAAFGEGAPLPPALYQAWVRSRGDKMRTLALAWAREQVRLALREIIEREGARAGVDAPSDALAWLALAGCEAIAHEPPAAAADRLATLQELLGIS